MSERSPKTSGFICRETLTLSALPVPFQHNDKYVLLIDEFFTLLKGTITVYRVISPCFFSHYTLANSFALSKICIDMVRKRYLPDRKLSLILIFILQIFRMTFTIKANIGGYLKLMNRENNNNIEYHSLTQSVHEREYLYHWDLVNPYHCVGVSPAGSCPQFLTVVDLTENVSISIFV